MSFSHEDKSLLVVGCENGCILKCTVPADTNTTIESHFTSKSEDSQVRVKTVCEPLSLIS